MFVHRDCPDTCRLLHVDLSCLQKCVTKAFTTVFGCFYFGDGMLQNTLLENEASQPCADVASTFISESGGTSLQAPLH